MGLFSKNPSNTNNKSGSQSRKNQPNSIIQMAHEKYNNMSEAEKDKFKKENPGSIFTSMWDDDKK